MGAPQFADNTKIKWLFILICLISVECVQPAAPQGGSPSVPGAAGATAGATAGAAECSLRLAGFGDRPGIKSASLSCTGGTITVAAHKELQNYWGQNKALPGVAWNDGDDCVTNKGCLLTICGKSNAVFEAATVTSLKADSGEAAWRLPVCVTKGSTVTFRRSSFTMNKDVAPLLIHSNGTSVLVDQCTIQGNTNTNGSFSSAVSIKDAHLTILSSTVAANTAAGTSSGAITATGTAQINIQGSSFMKNTAANGAAMHVRDQVVVTIQGSRFEANNATVRGGAILATNQAQVKVLPGKAGTGECLWVRVTHCWLNMSVHALLICPTKVRLLTSRQLVYDMVSPKTNQVVCPVGPVVP
jgi:predicted outer membrane repeat protein